MHTKFLTALIKCVVSLLVAALLVWQFGYNHISLTKGVLLWFVVAVLGAYALIVACKYILEASIKTFNEYKKLPESNKEAVRSFASDCAAVKRGEKDWCDVLQSQL